MRTSKQKVQPGPYLKENRLEVLVTVVNRRKAEFFADLIESFGVSFQWLVTGEGTMKSRTLDRPELVGTPKMVIFSVIRSQDEEKILTVLGEKFDTVRDGEGIAYAVPMSSVIGKLVYGFLSNQKNFGEVSRG